jgi:hypothetical protein
MVLTPTYYLLLTIGISSTYYLFYKFTHLKASFVRVFLGIDNLGRRISSSSGDNILFVERVDPGGRPLQEREERELIKETFCIPAKIS